MVAANRGTHPAADWGPATAMTSSIAQLADRSIIGKCRVKPSNRLRSNSSSLNKLFSALKW
jgi:hypothetical protein